MNKKRVIHVELPRQGGVYTLDTKKGYFWFDNVRPEVSHGPFLSLYEAMAHYRDILKVRKSQRSLGNVTYLDFPIRKKTFV